jgi:hypothetical protein
MISGSAFTWTTDVLLLMSAVISLIGGILAFNRRKIGGIFIVMAALICLFIHPSTRVYGWVYLAAGALAFVVRGSSDYDYEEGAGFDDEDEHGEDADDEEDIEREIFSARSIGGHREDSRESPYGGKRRERASRIRLDREEYSLSGDVIPKMGEPLRIRSSKVCPSCGASVGIEHKFCYTCGSPLHGTRVTVVDPAAGLAAETPSPDEGVDTKPVPENEDTEMAAPEEAREEAAPHRIFVRPSKEDSAESNQSFTVDPDNSYQEFSNYTRRRKRRRNSLARRVLGPLVLLLAVSGAAWLLLGLRKVSDPVPPPAVVYTTPEPEPFVPPPEPAIWDRIQMEDPARGVVTGSNVNVRQDHSVTGQIITKINSGTRAEIIGQWTGVTGALSGTWFNIRSNGRDGWIYGQYFQPLDGRQATLPGGYTTALLNSFGSDRAELAVQLGQPTRQTATTMTWTGLTMELRGDNNVVRLQVTGAQHVLQNEVAVGMTDEAFYRKVGYPSDYNQRTGQLRYVEIGGAGAEQGMVVRMQNGKVQSITVGNI